MVMNTETARRLEPGDTVRIHRDSVLARSSLPCIQGCKAGVDYPVVGEPEYVPNADRGVIAGETEHIYRDIVLVTIRVAGRPHRVSYEHLE